MILKGFKEKSTKKYLDKILSKREVSVSDSKIGSLGVILNADEITDFDKFRNLAEAINVRPNKLKIIAFIKNVKEVPNSWDTYFNPKDFGWAGKINNVELENFLNTPFDALISFYDSESLELKFLTARSKAHFKIGVLQNDKRLNDLIINTTTKDLELFKTELIKYLKIFNKIKHEQ